MFRKFVSVIKGKKFIVSSSVVLGLLILVFLLVFFNRSTPEKTLKEYINYVSENEYIKAAKLLAENEPEEFITPSSTNPFFYIERLSGLKLITYPPYYGSIPFCDEKAEVKKVEITEKYIWGEDALLTCLVMYEFKKPGIKGVVPEKKQNMITGKQLIHLKKMNSGWKILDAVYFGLGWNTPKEICRERIDALAESFLNESYKKSLEEQMPPDKIYTGDYFTYADYFKGRTIYETYGEPLPEPPAEYPKPPEYLNEFPICSGDCFLYKPFIDPVSGLPFNYEKISDEEFIIMAPEPEVLGQDGFGISMKLMQMVVTVEYTYEKSKLILESDCWVWNKEMVIEPPDEEFIEEIENIEEAETFEEAKKTIKIIEPAGLNIRTGPDTSYSSIDKAVLGGEFEYTEIKNGWYHVILPDGGSGWICGGQKGEKWVLEKK